MLVRRTYFQLHAYGGTAPGWQLPMTGTAIII